MKLKWQFCSGASLKKVKFHSLVLDLFFQRFGYQFGNRLDINIILFAEMNNRINVVHIAMLMNESFNFLGESRGAEKFTF